MPTLFRARAIIVAAAVAVLAASPVAAQQAETGLTAELLRSLEGIERKLISLAEEFPAESWDWRPGEGVRSTGEVYQHIAADNWFMPTALDVEAPAETGILAGDYATVQAYEGRTMSREQIMDELTRSFAHIKEGVRSSAGDPDRQVEFFGNDFTIRGMWLVTTTHIHEHLGQLIAYARTNSIVPPWSR